MFIDVHTHLWPPRKTPQEMLHYFEGKRKKKDISDLLSADGLLRAMEENHITLSIVASVALSANMNNNELEEINQYVHHQVKASGGKLVGFCTVDPHGGNYSLDIFSRCFEKLGFRGLKLHPSIQMVYPNDRQLYPLYAFAQKHKLPVLFHTGGIGIVPFRDKFAFPYFLDDVASDFPELIIILGHGGRLYYDQTVMLLRKHSNVYADISTNFGRSSAYKSVPLEWLLQKVKVWAGNFEKILFGSDFPFYHQSETIDALYKTMTTLNIHDGGFIGDEDMENILHGNFRRCCHQLTLA